MTLIEYLISEQEDDADGVYVKLKPREIRDPTKRRDALRAQKRGQNKNIRRKQLLQKKRDIEQKLRDL